MILGIEIGLFVMGIIALATGKMKFSASKVVEGTPARLLGALAVGTLPLVFGLGFLYGFVIGFQNPNGVPPQQLDRIKTNATIMEVGVVGLVCVLLFGIGFSIAGPSEEDRRQRRRRRREREEEEEEADEYDDAPRARRRRDDDDDDDEPPRRRPRRDRDDDDDYDRPRRRRDEY